MKDAAKDGPAFAWPAAHVHVRGDGFHSHLQDLFRSLNSRFHRCESFAGDSSREYTAPSFTGKLASIGNGRQGALFDRRLQRRTSSWGCSNMLPTSPCMVSAPTIQAEGPVGFWVDAVYWSRSRTLQWEIYHRIRDINDANAVQAWLSGTVTTCADVLKTIRAYHDGVIRPELFHYINQVEKVVATLDDRIAIHQENLHWFAFENRVHQKRKCGLTATLSG